MAFYDIITPIFKGSVKMATETEKLRWELYRKKNKILCNSGIRNGFIKYYNAELLSKLRNIYYGGLPLSILLLHEDLTKGYCYYRAPLVTLAFTEDEFRVVYADIDGIRLNPKYIDEHRNGLATDDYGDHCFVERKMKNGITWVYDTSSGLIFEKSLYYKMERPKIRHINDKNKTLNFLYEDFIKDSNIEKEKYWLPIILPLIEKNLKTIHSVYQEQLKYEIENLKKQIKYDEICNEIHEDMIAKGFIKRYRINF